MVGNTNVQGELLVHIAEGVVQNVGSAESASAALIAVATDTKVRHGLSFRPCESLPLGHVSSQDLLLDSLKEEFGMGLILFFLDQRTNNGSERNTLGLLK